VAKGQPEVYRPADACKIAEVAPYVLRYWETEFAALSEGKDKGGSRLYTARDVKIISRIRELLYDEGFTVAGAKKRLDSEIAEGRFDGGLASAPPVGDQRKGAAPAAKSAATPSPRLAPPAPPPSSRAASPEPVAASRAEFDRQRVVKELKEIVKLLDRR
jgi:DNA-binding transcriptional MerR regulator